MDKLMATPVTRRIDEIIFKLLESHPDGMRWTDLIREIQMQDSTLHPKTINGCVWKLVEKYPEKVYKTDSKLFRLVKYR